MSSHRIATIVARQKKIRATSTLVRLTTTTTGLSKSAAHKSQPILRLHNVTQQQHRFISTTSPTLDDTNTQQTNTRVEPDISQYSPNVQATFQKIKVLDSIQLHLLAELVKEKLGFEVHPGEMNAFRGGGGGPATTGDAPAAAAAATEEKTAFDLKLTGFDAKSKIKVIKEVRAITSAGLKEAKEMVEGVPKVLKKGIKMEEAEELKKKLEEIGATVEIS